MRKLFFSFSLNEYGCQIYLLNNQSQQNLYRYTRSIFFQILIWSNWSQRLPLGLSGESEIRFHLSGSCLIYRLVGGFSASLWERKLLWKSNKTVKMLERNEIPATLLDLMTLFQITETICESHIANYPYWKSVSIKLADDYQLSWWISLLHTI